MVINPGAPSLVVSGYGFRRFQGSWWDTLARRDDEQGDERNDEQSEGVRGASEGVRGDSSLDKSMRYDARSEGVRVASRPP